MGREIKIIIASQAGFGKTTLSLEIKKHLEKFGFKVDFIDDDPIPPPCMTEEEIHKRVQNIAKHIDKIEISTKQLKYSK